jgi:hypothetical protein
MKAKVAVVVMGRVKQMEGKIDGKDKGQEKEDERQKEGMHTLELDDPQCRSRNGEAGIFVTRDPRWPRQVASR